MFRTIDSGRAKPLSPVSKQRVRATLRSALTSAEREGPVSRNVAKFVEIPRGTPRTDQIHAWTGAQLQAFLDSTSALRMWPVLSRTLALAGLRRGEVAGLQWQDVDLDKGQLRVRQQLVVVGHQVEVGEPKTQNSRRAVALDPTTVAELRSWKAQQAAERLSWGSAYQNTGYAFTAEDGSPLHPERITKTFLRLQAKVDVPRIRLHELRHTSASLLLAAGVAMKTVSSRLGHSSISITADTYSHVLEVVDHDAAIRIAAMLG